MSLSPEQERFWSKGIRFQCQGSGKCCTSRGQYGYVYLTLKDRQRFARFFGLKTLQFTRRYCRKQGPYFHLRNVETDCEFLVGNRCSVYEARPMQCRTWPFWPENLNPKTWRKEVAAFCPGVGKGRQYSKEEILNIAAEEQ